MNQTRDKNAISFAALILVVRGVRSGLLDLPLQRKFLNLLPPPLSALGVLRVNEVVEWRRSAVTTGWHPSIVNQEKLLEVMEDPNIEAVADVGGCLEEAYPPGRLRDRVIARLHRQP